MTESHDTGYLSIGEVLGLLLEEFPDVTISKIRFLESQGLIAPERTASGYRKFYEHDIELLRVILREQREHYLPLRVIKNRIASGELDPSGELRKPPARDGAGGPDDGDESDDEVEVPPSSIAAHPAAAHSPGTVRPSATTIAPGRGGPARSTSGARPDPVGATAARAATDATPASADHTPVTPQLLPGVVLDRSELCAMVGITPAELAQLEDFGIVQGRGSGGGTLYHDDAVEVAKVAVEFMRSGVDARHLRAWRNAAEREAMLYEQLITPRLRQRNPESRAEALDQLRRLDLLGAKLRSALMRTTLRHHFEG